MQFLDQGIATVEVENDFQMRKMGSVPVVSGLNAMQRQLVSGARYLCIVSAKRK